MRTPEQIDADTDRTVKPFSNHSEYEIWASRHCYECVNDDANAELYCPILGAALLHGWPREWTRRTHTWQIGDKSGSYEVVDTCTEFVQRPEWPGDDDPGERTTTRAGTRVRRTARPGRRLPADRAR
jgi:hypothetical protein